MPTPEKLKELLKEIQKVKLFEKIKSTKDLDAVVDILKLIFDRFSVAKGEKGDTPVKGIDYWTEEEVNKIISDITNKVQQLIRVPKKGIDYFDGKDYILTEKDKKEIASSIKLPIVEKVIETIVEKQPIITNEIKEVAIADTPEMIKSKLESLEDSEKLKISDIYKLQDELEKLRKQIAIKTPMFIGGGSSSGGRIVKALDLSASLNGSTRTFNTQAFWRPISVHLSSFPNILRETVDFSWTPTSLTLTSEISDIAISTGQTLIFVIAE